MSSRHLAAALLAVTATLAAPAAARASTVALANASPAHEQVVSGARMTALAGRVAAGLIDDPDRTIAAAFPVADQYVPAGTVAIATGMPQVNPTYIAVPMQITVDGRVVRTVVAGYRVQQYTHTAVAARDLAPGTVLTTDDITMQRVLSNGRPGVDAGSLVGRRMNIGLSRGGLLYVEQTAIVNLVKSGSGVILIVRDGPVALTADVIARTDGGMGQSVTVYDARTNKVLSGIVVGPNSVELNLPGEDE
jgi:flagella basal body P-ring formation protein FlgA